jgi:hypothetical protein
MSLLTGWDHQLAAAVERFLLVKDVGSHRLTPPRLRFGGPPRVARLLEAQNDTPMICCSSSDQYA